MILLSKRFSHLYVLLKAGHRKLVRAHVLRLLDVRFDCKLRFFLPWEIQKDLRSDVLKKQQDALGGEFNFIFAYGNLRLRYRRSKSEGRLLGWD
jgi:hypothetical protein